MNPETIEALVKIFQGVGADTRQIVSMVLAFWFASRVLICLTVGVLVGYLLRILSRLVSNVSMAKGMQHDLGYIGKMVFDEKEHILKVWRAGLAATNGGKDVK